MINNRKANFNYYVEDTINCGIVLLGGEVKSIRNGNATINDSFAIIEKNEVWMINSYIQQWKGTNHNLTGGYDPVRRRKLLLKRKEINKLAKAIQTPGYTLIPLKVFFTERGLCKVQLGVCKGKHDYDKRETIKKRDLERELNLKL